MKYTVELNEESTKTLKQIVDYTKQEPVVIIEDLVQTFCNMPSIVACDLAEFCIKKIDECNVTDAHRKICFTNERINQFQRIQFFIEIIYKSQVEQLKKIQESKE